MKKLIIQKNPSFYNQSVEGSRKLSKNQFKLIDRFLRETEKACLDDYNIDVAYYMVKQILNGPIYTFQLHLSVVGQRSNTFTVSDLYECCSIMNRPHIVQQQFSLFIGQFKTPFITFKDKFFKNRLTKEYDHNIVFNSQLDNSEDLKDSYISRISEMSAGDIGRMLQNFEYNKKYFTKEEIAELKNTTIPLPFSYYEGTDTEAVSEILTLDSLEKGKSLAGDLPEFITLTLNKKNSLPITKRYKLIK